MTLVGWKEVPSVLTQQSGRVYFYLGDVCTQMHRRNQERYKPAC